VKIHDGSFAATPTLNARPVSTYNAPLFPAEHRMARVCQVTGKKPQVGHHVSHATTRPYAGSTRTCSTAVSGWKSEKRWVRLRTSNAGVRIIDKKGIDAVLKELRERGEI